MLTLEVCWEHEDELPTMKPKIYEAMYGLSKVVQGVRMFPYIWVGNAQLFLVDWSEVE